MSFFHGFRNHTFERLAVILCVCKCLSRGIRVKDGINILHCHQYLYEKALFTFIVYLCLFLTDSEYYNETL